MTWEEVVKRPDLIGGDIEAVENGTPYRGPLASINVNGKGITFRSPWIAKLNQETGEWEKWNITSLFVNAEEIKPNDAGNGRVLFHMPMLGHCTLFPKDGSKLDPSKVKGLPKASERLLALFPALVFDRKAAEKVLTDKCWPHQAEALAGMSGEVTLNDLLSSFRNDSSVEEFLWHYIEAVTGEKDIHHKVY